MDIIKEDSPFNPKRKSNAMYTKPTFKGSSKPIERGSTLRVNAITSLQSRNSMSGINNDMRVVKPKEENIMDKFWNEEAKSGPKIREIIESI